MDKGINLYVLVFAHLSNSSLATTLKNYLLRNLLK